MQWLKTNARNALIYVRQRPRRSLVACALLLVGAVALAQTQSSPLSNKSGPQAYEVVVSQVPEAGANGIHVVKRGFTRRTITVPIYGGVAPLLLMGVLLYRRRR